VLTFDSQVFAITGASGFIGGRLAEMLTLSGTGQVRAVVRSYARLARLSELPADRMSFEAADIKDPAALRRAFQGVDVVVHCAFGNSGSPAQQFADTVEGTSAVIEAAKAQGVSRLVYIGTAAVHDFSLGGDLHEDSPLASFDPGSYEEAKWLAEAAVHASGLDTIVLRPTVVYGPWGRDWTSTPLRRLREGQAMLPDGNCQGISNAVHVDDVVRAILLAARSQAGGAFLVSGAEEVTWGRFYDGLRDILPPGNHGTAPLDAWEAGLYAATARVKSARARQVLGYQPRVSWAQGLASVAAWAEWYGFA
jgi:nucleoside-diphosphate-sugar epimerase